ncbi:GspH/FimT family pseudopilin, partial [Leptospira sp. SA-E8]|uniref:GspH/FimT family pseudopilin n=1 Tax=Leptospira sp. SA-E8 TaxID=3422259 RepID=UPI003EBD9ABB
RLRGRVTKLAGMKHVPSIVRPRPGPALRRIEGFTLVELMMVVAIVAVLMTLAAPGYQAFLLRRGVQVAMDALVEDLRYARSEALTRSGRVSVCSSLDGAVCASPPDWLAGWIVFADADGNGAVDAGDRVLRARESSPYLAALSAPGLRASIVYESTGWARAAGRTFTFTPAQSAFDVAARIVCVSNQ